MGWSASSSPPSCSPPLSHTGLFPTLTIHPLPPDPRERYAVLNIKLQLCLLVHGDNLYVSLCLVEFLKSRRTERRRRRSSWSAAQQKRRDPAANSWTVNTHAHTNRSTTFEKTHTVWSHVPPQWARPSECQHNRFSQRLPSIETRHKNQTVFMSSCSTKVPHQNNSLLHVLTQVFNSNYFNN